MAGRVHDDRNHWAVTAAADTNDDVLMASSPTPEELATARELVRAAQARGVSFADTADGVLKALTKTVVETALEEELSDHLGYDKHDPVGRNGGNSRNGTRTKTVLTDTVGEIEIQVPRDRAGSFDPQIVRKHQRRLTRVDEIVLSLYAKGLTTGEIAAHFDELYEAKISGHDQSDHRQDHRRHGRLGVTPVGADLCRGLHRCLECEGPRRAGGQSAVLCRDRGGSGRAQGCAGVVGRRRRRGIIWNEHMFVSPDSCCCLRVSGLFACR